MPEAEPLSLTALESALATAVREAHRAPAVFGTELHPSAWDGAHAHLDYLLTLWCAAHADTPTPAG